MIRQIRAALLSVAVMTVLCGLLFPGLVTVIAQLVFPHQANGSLVTLDGRSVGSELIGQAFSAPEYFHPRPSAAGAGYDASSSAGTNLGPTSNKLINGIHASLANVRDASGDFDGRAASNDFDGIRDLAKAYRRENDLAENALLPADAVTRSASGLDPHISPANARLQAARVARARGISEQAVQRLVAEHTQRRQFAILGEPRVNVLALNLALDRLRSTPR